MTDGGRRWQPPRAALLDAMGTLLSLQPPGPLLAARLAANGAPITAEEAAHAFRVEIEYYREHHMEGSDRESLATLRDGCAAAMHAALPASARARITVASLRDAMLDSLRFDPAPCAQRTLRALRAMGMSLIVVSNWDVSLGEALQRTGLRGELDGVVTSAGLGVAKPDPAIFERALRLAGAEPAEAIHIGDSPQQDVGGAAGAGIQPILISATAACGVEAGTPGSAGAGARNVPVIASLCELPRLLRMLGEQPAHA